MDEGSSTCPLSPAGAAEANSWRSPPATYPSIDCAGFLFDITLDGDQVDNTVHTAVSTYCLPAMATQRYCCWAAAEAAG